MRLHGYEKQPKDIVYDLNAELFPEIATGVYTQDISKKHCFAVFGVIFHDANTRYADFFF